MGNTRNHGGVAWRVVTAALAALVVLTGFSLGGDHSDTDRGSHSLP